MKGVKPIDKYAYPISIIRQRKSPSHNFLIPINTCTCNPTPIQSVHHGLQAYHRYCYCAYLYVSTPHVLW
jgi:hypothetical protein